jgi:hypothetical protein
MSRGAKGSNTPTRSLVSAIASAAPDSSAGAAVRPVGSRPNDEPGNPRRTFRAAADLTEPFKSTRPAGRVPAGTTEGEGI